MKTILANEFDEYLKGLKIIDDNEDEDNKCLFSINGILNMYYLKTFDIKYIIELPKTLHGRLLELKEVGLIGHYDVKASVVIPEGVCQIYSVDDESLIFEFPLSVPINQRKYSSFYKNKYIEYRPLSNYETKYYDGIFIDKYISIYNKKEVKIIVFPYKG